MNTKLTILILAIGIAGILGTSCKKQEVPPNIIFIIADDLGYSQVGCYGTDYYQTPHINNLAKEGMRFTNAYAACSVCSPTRASIMTGKYPARLHITNFIPGNNRNDYSLKTPDWQKFLPLREKTVAELLKEKGYRTAFFGKWHLSIAKMPPESLPYNPDKQGFDESFVTYKPSGNMIQPWQEAENDAHNVDTITNRALDFLERNKFNPFFLYVSHNTIHDPLKEHSSTIQKYERLDASKEPENNPVIGAMIERLDNSCGRIFDKVSELGLDKNTIIIFFSDNGGYETDAAQTPLRRGKGWFYEGGIRVPFIVRWKGTIKPQTTSTSLVSSIDFLPTFLELAGLSNIPQNVDGKSLVPIFKNPEEEVHQTLFWHFPHYPNYGDNGGPPCGAIRDGKWKLIEWYEESLLGNKDNAYELYNLEEDEGESNNLAKTMKNKTEELAKELKEWREEVNAQMPVPNPDSCPKPGL